jgi:MFS family permease
VTSGPLAPLRRPEVAKVWGAGVVSDVGTWVQLVIVGSLIARTTGSALLTGLVAMATFTPQGVFSPIGGMLADRFDRRKLFGFALAGQALATTILAVLLSAHVTNAYALTAVIFFQSSFGAFGAPAFQAMMPDLVPAEELQAMVGLSIASWNSGRILGPILATLLDRSIGAPGAIIANALTFAGMSIAIMALRRAFPPTARYGGETVKTQILVGLRATRATPGCWVAIQAMVTFNFIIAPFIALMPIFARRVLHGGTGLSGTLSSAQGVGALSGALGLSFLIRRYDRYATILGAISLMSVSYLIYAHSPSALTAVLILPFLGFGATLVFASMMALIQRDAPSDQRGRVISMFQAITGSSYGVAILCFGRLSDVIGLRWSMTAAATFGILATIFAIVRYPHWRGIIDIPRALDTRPANWQLLPEI